MLLLLLLLRLLLLVLLPLLLLPLVVLLLVQLPLLLLLEPLLFEQAAGAVAAMPFLAPSPLLLPGIQPLVQQRCLHSLREQVAQLCLRFQAKLWREHLDEALTGTPESVGLHLQPEAVARQSGQRHW